MKIHRKPGYSEETRKGVFPDNTKLFLISQVAIPVQEWEDHHPTGKIKGYRLWVTSPDAPEPFYITFKNEVHSLPPYLSQISLNDWEGCEVRSNIYFRASGLEVVK